MKNSFLSLLILLSSSVFAQNIHMFRTIYYPAEPFGGEQELKEFVKQEMVYPEQALNEEIEGDVFITYLIDPKGKVAYKKVEDEGDELLQKEASRIFDKIMWEADASRDPDALGYEKIKFSFDLKKYKKTARKRGYHHLPYDSSLIISEKLMPISLKTADTIPEISNSGSIDQIVSENFKFPSIAKERGISGRVVVEFVIEPYGLASNVRVLEPLAGGCNEETVRLVKLMRWKPAIKDGKAVRCFYRYSLNFMNPQGSFR